MSNRRLIAATLGDPAGIGPEVCVKAAQGFSAEDPFDLLLIGDLRLIRETAAACGCERRFEPVLHPAEARGQAFVGVFDPLKGAPLAYTTGQSSASAGHAALQWIACANDLGSQGLVDAVVFGPVNSDALKLTGLIKEIDDLQPAGTYMLRVSGGLRVMPITEHLRMRDVAQAVTADAVTAAGLALNGALRRWGFERPRLAVAGLNPHAMFEEDRDEIAPAVQRLVAQGVQAVGPVPPDAVFRRAMGGEFDAVLSMYHDQGQIAIKTAAFSGACTLYVGLNHVQIAIPHGTAYDIAGKWLADPSSFAAGVRMAARLAGGAGFS